ncbi:MAG: hypothetical protein M3460_28715 [Actinomycetota bacterium]|nr:hypothetical protein [Actinomycetota bacterium]
MRASESTDQGTRNRPRAPYTLLRAGPFRPGGERFRGVDTDGALALLTEILAGVPRLHGASCGIGHHDLFDATIERHSLPTRARFGESVALVAVVYFRGSALLFTFSTLFRWADADHSLVRRVRRIRGAGETVHGEALAGGQMKEALS